MILTEPSAQISRRKMLRRGELGLAKSLMKLCWEQRKRRRVGLMGNLKVFSGRGIAVHFVIAGILVGVLLGLLRFKVLVLVPTISIAACAIIVTGHELKVIAFNILATAALLQIGYLMACTARVYADAHLCARKEPRNRLSKSKPGANL
jgi:hypothetical protein